MDANINSKNKQQIINDLKTKLLDTTLRNPLINFKGNENNSINILCNNISELLLSIERNQKNNAYSIETKDTDESITSIEKNVFFSHRTIDGLQKTLNTIYSKCKLMLEERGINVLYLAFGILEWVDLNGNSIRSPLAFLPLQISRRHLKDIPKITILDNEHLQVNNSLEKKISTELKKTDLFTVALNPEASLSDEYKQIRKNFEVIANDINKLNENNENESEWRIVDEVNISIFPFSSINVYNNLCNSEDEVSNSLIMNVLASDVTLDNASINEPIVNETDIDNSIDPTSYYHVLKSNSSQEAAIQSAIKGQSFIIQGPPGTGKSHTITNIICELLARNKKILFVSEKLSAINVVYNLLEKIGLSNWVLRLHSNEIKKQEFYQELGRTLELSKNYQSVPSETVQKWVSKYNNSINEIEKFKTNLTQKRGSISKSIYELIGEYQKLVNLDSQDLIFNIPNYVTITQEKYEELIQKVNNFELKLNIINRSPKQNPWYGIKDQSLSLTQKEHNFELFNKIKSLLNNLKHKMLQMLSDNAKNNIDSTPLESLSLINKLLADSTKFNLLDKYNNMFYDSFKTLPDHIEKIVNSLKKYEDHLSEITQKYKPESLNKNPHEMLQKALLYKEKSKLAKFFSKEYRSIKKELLKYKIKRKINDVELINDLESFNIAHEQKNNIDLDLNACKNIFNIDYSGMNYEKLSNELSSIKYFAELNRLFDMLHLNTFQSKMQCAQMFRDIGALADEYRQIFSEFDTKINEFNSLFTDNILQYSIENESLKDVERKLHNLTNVQFTYEDYIDFHRSYCQLENDEYTKEFAQYIIQNIDSKKFTNLKNIFAKRFILLITDSFINKFMPNWSSVEYENILREYKQTLDYLSEIAKYKIIQKVIENTPVSGESIISTNHKILNQQIAKSRNKMPILSYIEKYGDFLTTIKPCLMLSPTSFSTYFARRNVDFDVVIFDEASQLKTEFAICPLSAAKQFIIAGDNKQLPPTNFFQSVDNPTESDGNITSESDFESILDRMQGKINDMMLKWHYRSIYEELITPSNEFLYDNRLITFPSPTKSRNLTDEYKGIKFLKINGIYEDQTNEIEAEYIINLLLDLRKQYGNSKSIGVVTFNLKQAALIENKLRKYVKNNPIINKLYDENKLFVKNIETVQGDERDIIILGITFGQNRKGTISMNFGALNTKGGERRLNVAVTRAKISTIIVSSINYSDIRVESVQNKGLVFLQEYLKYAQYGPNSNTEKTLEQGIKTFNSAFELEVYKEIEKLGFKVNNQVGSSRFKIDLGVLNPQDDSQYTLGIECDGATYLSSFSALDRDFMRQSFLESRGWNIYRIWSTNWFKNTEYEIKKLHQAIENSLKNLNKPQNNDLILEQNIDNGSDNSEQYTKQTEDKNDENVEYFSIDHHQQINRDEEDEEEEYVETTHKEIEPEKLHSDNEQAQDLSLNVQTISRKSKIEFDYFITYDEFINKFYIDNKQLIIDFYSFEPSTTLSQRLFSTGAEKNRIKNFVSLIINKIFEYYNTLDINTIVMVVKKCIPDSIYNYVLSYFKIKELINDCLDIHTPHFLTKIYDRNKEKYFYHKIGSSLKPLVCKERSDRSFQDLAEFEVCYLMLYILKHIGKTSYDDFISTVLTAFNVKRSTVAKNYASQMISKLAKYNIIIWEENNDVYLAEAYETQDTEELITKMFNLPLNSALSDEQKNNL
ncbi:DUF4011 domain-containing protein [Mycoplasmopsis opalescens]|uniref:DUF4011 domain-containing protein n=1 Tax=Mycoplasmopsis opalescens TaxID=114886 RepID=UPI0004A72D3B|nr:DUF4011 domain-containing protein [Mycoplasmopsis opalescens]